MPIRRPAVRFRKFRPRAQELRAILACLVLTFLNPLAAQSQTLTGNMLNPVQDGFAPAGQSALRRTADQTIFSPQPEAPAASRIGNPPKYEIPAASGASDTGFDSLNRKLKKPKPYPGAPKPKVVGPGNSPATTAATAGKKVTAPIAPSVAGTFAGQPPRRRLKVDDDPFGQVGFHVGSFLAKGAIEIGGGYNTNPERLTPPTPSSLYMVSPELQIASDWSRHSLTADLRGSFTGYSVRYPPLVDCNCVPPVLSPSPVPTNPDRPAFTGKIDGRIDVSHDTRINTELRLTVATDNPGSPNIQAGLSKFPLATTVGGTAGIEREFNRFSVNVAGLADRTTYTMAELTDGTSTTNDDRNFNQLGGLGRLSYDLMPGLKPFAEVQADNRTHDLNFDRSGYQRDSNGGYVKAGSTFEFTRLLTGEAAIGWAERSYQDPRLNKLTGLLTSASLVWTATGLTTVRFDATSSIDETTLAGVSGSLSRDYSLTVDHAFRRWLIGTAKIGTGTTDYETARTDRRYFIEGDVIYKMTRDYHIKATVRKDWTISSDANASTNATLFMLGVRLQR